MSAVGDTKIREEDISFSFEMKRNEENEKVDLFALQNLPRPDFISLKRRSERLYSKTNIACRAPKKVRDRAERVRTITPKKFYFPTFTAKNAAG